MSDNVDIQFASAASGLPTAAAIRKWVAAALLESQRDAELTVRIVDEDEISELNQNYRHKSGPTNVLSFPAELPETAGLNLLGDIVICASIVVAEAGAQGKSADAHWAHMIVHGTLHLQGFDHQNEAQAAKMEDYEVDILARLGYSNPYETGDPVVDNGTMKSPR